MAPLTEQNDSPLDKDYQDFQLDVEIERMRQEALAAPDDEDGAEEEEVANDVPPQPAKPLGSPIERLEEFKKKQTFAEQIPAGMTQAANEVLDTIDSFVGDDRIQFLDKDGKLITPRMVSGEEAEKLIMEGVPDFTRFPEWEKADSGAKEAVRDLSSFLTKFFLIRSKLGKAQSTAGQIAKDTAAAGGAGFTQPVDQQGLAEILQSVPIAGDIFEALLNDEEDSDLVKRTKNLAEEMGFGAVIDSTIRAFKVGGKALLKDSEEVILPLSDEFSKPLSGIGSTAEDAPLIGKPSDFATAVERTAPEDLIGQGFVQVESGGEDVFINFAKINEPDEVKGLIDTLAQAEVKGIKKAQRGKISFEETEALADELGLTPGQVMSRLEGAGFANAEHAVAARKLMAASGKNLLNLSKIAAKADATPQDLFAFRRAVAMHKALQSEVLGAQAETARALSSFRIPVDGSDSVAAIQAALDNVGGDKVSMKLAQRLAVLEKSGASTAAINAAARKGFSAATSDAVSEAFVTGLLWTPSTHIVNMTGNTMALAFSVGNRRIAEAANTFTGNTSKGVAQGEAMASIHGLKMGFMESLLHVSRVARGLESEMGGVSRQATEAGRAHGAISADAFGVQPGALATGIDMLGSAVRAPGKVLTINDEFFKGIGYRMELHALAWRTATNEGIDQTSEEFAKRVDELVKNPTKEIKLEATDAVLYNTFQNKTGAIGEGVVKFRGGLGPVGTWFLPFARTPVNLFRFSLEHSPAAPVVGQWREDFAAGGARKQMALAKMTNGILMAGFAVDLAQAGHITGGGPLRKDKGESQALRRQGVAHNSFVVGDKTYPFNRFDPVVATTLSVAADVYDISQRFDWPEDDDATGVVQAFAVATGRAMTNKTYTKAMADIADALTDDSGRGFERVLGQIASASVPFSTLASSVERTIDPELRETMTILDDIQARIPGLSSRLIPRRDLWGRTREEAGGGAGPFLPVNPKDIKDSVVDREIFRHNVPTLEIGWKGVSFDGVKVDFNEFRNVLDEYRVLAGNGIKDFNGDGALDKLTKVVTGGHFESEVYDLRTDGMNGGKSQYIQSVISDFRKLAQQEILTNPKYAEDPEFVKFRRHVQEVKAAAPSEFNFR